MYSHAEKATDEMQGESVCAVVVTRNRLSLLQECIAAIRAQTLIVDEILVIDNDSSDGTQEWLASHPALRSIFQANLGGAGGFHRGIEEALGFNSVFIWVMDDDTIPEPDALKALVQAMRIVPEAAYCCSRVLLPDGCIANVPRYKQRSYHGVQPTQYLPHAIIPVSACTFVSVIFKREVVETIGLPKTEMFIWGDDIEYTSRASKLGPGFVAGHSCVLHKSAGHTKWQVSQETDSNRIRLYKHKFRNDLFNAWFYGSLIDLLCVIKEVCIEIGRSFPSRTKVALKLRAICAGVWLGVAMIVRQNLADCARRISHTAET